MAETPAGRVILYLLLGVFVAPLFIYSVSYAVAVFSSAADAIPYNDTVAGGAVGGVRSLLSGLFGLLRDPYVVAVFAGVGLLLGVLQARGS